MPGLSRLPGAPTRRGRAPRTATAVAGVAFVVAAAGCSAQVAPGAAAVSGSGEPVVSVEQVQQTSQELRALDPQGQSIEQSVLWLYLTADDVRQAAERNESVVSAESQQQAVEEQLGVQISEEAAQILATQQMFATLPQAGQERVNDALGESGITVNPRFGALGTLQNGLNFIVPESPAWLVSESGATGAAQPG